MLTNKVLAVLAVAAQILIFSTDTGKLTFVMSNNYNLRKTIQLICFYNFFCTLSKWLFLIIKDLNKDAINYINNAQ